jgi:hypothetical protein
MKNIKINNLMIKLILKAVMIDICQKKKNKNMMILQMRMKGNFL